jgi:tetratricopeptide (TPR) repeat protein
MRPNLAITRALLALVALLALAATAEAQEREIARRHFEAGKALAARNQHQAAIAEFEQALAVAPLPGIIYNLGYSHSRLAEAGSVEDARQARQYFRKYLALRPGADNRRAVEAALAVLERQIAAAETRSPRADRGTASPLTLSPPPPSTPATLPPAATAQNAPTAVWSGPTVAAPGRRPPGLLAAAVVGAVAVGTLATGVGLYGWVAGKLSDCGEQQPAGCAPSTVDGWKPAGYAGYALIALGAALAATDVALWIVVSKRRRPGARAWLAPTGNGIVAGGAF